MLRIAAAVLLAVGVIVTLLPPAQGGRSLWTYQRTESYVYREVPAWCYQPRSEAVQKDPATLGRVTRDCGDLRFNQVATPFSGDAISANIVAFSVFLVLLVLSGAALVLAAKVRLRPDPLTDRSSLS